jgi:hypothetical protein
MSEQPWYSLDGCKVLLNQEDSATVTAEWLCRHLNFAFQKGEQMSGVRDARVERNQAQADLAAARQEILAVERRCENLRVDGERLIDKVLARDTEIERLTIEASALPGLTEAYRVMIASHAAQRQEIERLKSDLEDARKGLTPFPHEFAERFNRMFSESDAKTTPPPIAALKQLAAQNPPPQEWFDDAAESATAGVPSQEFCVAPSSLPGQWYVQQKLHEGYVVIATFNGNGVLVGNSLDRANAYCDFLNATSPLHRENAATQKLLEEALRLLADLVGVEYDSRPGPVWMLVALVECVENFSQSLHRENAELRERLERVMAAKDERRQELAQLRERLAACERDHELLEWMGQEVITIHTPSKIGNDWTAVRDRATWASGPTLIEAILALHHKLEAK